ncbi:hypothetical protein VNI00_007398 [Paramarasmius palmivorus]|uniref:rRNA adenine N(6)-methyltransferase n=1 Tax=Paramarasmius palmivorus TaxID=297713 RepID=A0AAW0CZY6_9AGAR
MSFLRPCLRVQLATRYTRTQIWQTRLNSTSAIPETPKKRGRPKKVDTTFPEPEIRPKARPRKAASPQPKATEEKTPSLTKERSKSGRKKIIVEDHLPPPEQRTELPPVSQWQKLFHARSQSHRVSLADAEVAPLVADAFVPEGSKGKVIIEAFPGPGVLTRALLKLPRERIDRIIVLEDYEKYYDFLHPLEALDPRIKVINMSGHYWDTYDYIHEQGLLNDIEKLSWDAGVHPILQFIAHLPINVHGEQLLNQYIRFIPDRHWLFDYGRVPMNFLLNEWIWGRMTTRDPLSRSKLTAVADALVDSDILLYDELQPYRDHFYPVSALLASKADYKVTDRRKAGFPFQAVSVVPVEKPLIGPGEMDAWDYCLRRLFVQKATPIEKAIMLLGPGGSSLVQEIVGKIPLEKSPRELTMEEWSALVKVFNEWPFRPSDLSISDLMPDSEGRQTHRTR